jgi:hypothetical protein
VSMMAALEFGWFTNPGIEGHTQRMFLVVGPSS